MSLLHLPDELIAQVTSHLEFTDISSLKQSCRRIQRVIKEYKLDKPNIRELSVSKACNNNLKFDVVYCCPRKQPERIFVVAADEMLQKTAAMINKCRTIQKLKLHNFKIDSLLVEMLAGISNKIRKVHCELGSVDLSAASFVDFCRSFKATNMRNVELKPHHITDEVFSQIIPNTFIHSEGGDRIPTELTDYTLEALINGPSIQCRFVIENFITHFSVNGIGKLIDKVVEVDENGLQWNFGILTNDQEARAARLVKKLISLPGRPFEVVRRWKSRCISYEINQNPKEIDYGLYDIEEYPDMYDMCFEEPDSVGTIEFCLLSR